MFDWEKFHIFFQNDNLIIKNIKISKILSLFFVSFFKKTFNKDDFILFLKENKINENDTNVIIKLLLNNDIFLDIEEWYKELFYISKKWYNPYNINHKLNYVYDDISYYYEKNKLFSKEIVDIEKISKNYWKILKMRRSTRTEYIDTKKNIDSDLDKLLKLAYWNIDYRQHIHVCTDDKISTIHKTVPSAWWFYNIILFSLLQDWTINYFNWEKNIKISSGIDYMDFIDSILTKSAIHVIDNNNQKHWAIQFVNIENTKWIIFTFWITDKIYKKYYNKTLPFLLLESWHISQNISLFSNDFNIWTLEIWSIFEEKISLNLEKYITNKSIKQLFKDKKLLYMNTTLIWYTKEY